MLYLYLKKINGSGTNIISNFQQIQLKIIFPEDEVNVEINVIQLLYYFVIHDS